MKLLWVSLLICTSMFAQAQTKAEKEVDQAVQELRTAMINADRATLEKIAATKLSYGHSSGVIDDKQQFVQKIADGTSDYVSIDLKNQTIAVSGNVAIVRHELHASIADGGKPGELHLRVLLVWQKEGKQWKLMARQAVKIL